MKCRAYQKSDYAALSLWLIHRGIEAWDETDIPLIGYVALTEGMPVAMGFLRRVEIRSAMLDGLCTNPHAAPEVRNEAIDLVVNKLLGMAKTCGLTSILSFSVDKNTLERAVKVFGFEPRPEQTIIVKLLEK